MEGKLGRFSGIRSLFGPGLSTREHPSTAIFYNQGHEIGQGGIGNMEIAMEVALKTYGRTQAKAILQGFTESLIERTQAENPQITKRQRISGVYARLADEYEARLSQQEKIEIQQDDGSHHEIKEGKSNPIAKFREWRRKKLDKSEFSPDPSQRFFNNGIEIGYGGIGEMGKFLDYTDTLTNSGERIAARRGFARAVSMNILGWEPNEYFAISTLSTARKETIDSLTSSVIDLIIQVEHSRARVAILEKGAENRQKT